MFSGYFNSQPDQDGEFFIDRNPKHFPLILDYLRNQHSIAVKKNIIDLNCVEIEELLEEADYYGIIPLLEMIGSLSIRTISAKGKPWKLILSRPNFCFPNNAQLLNNFDIASGAGTGINSNDFIEAVFDEKVIVSRIILAATTLGGIDETRLNGAVFQASQNGLEWKDILIVSQVPKQGLKIFVFCPTITGIAFRFLHGTNITSDRCLALGILIFE